MFGIKLMPAGKIVLAILVIATWLPGRAMAVLPPHFQDITPGFTIALDADAISLDPAVTLDGDSRLVTSQIYDTLVTYASGGNSVPVPGLATNWSVSSDKLTWTFNLRPGVKFHDGTDLDASAVLFNFNRWWDPANPYHVGSFDYFEALFGGFKGDAGCIVANASAPNATQWQITLTKPFSPLPSIMAEPALAIASPSAIQGGNLATSPVGSGPFKFGVWVAGDHIRLDKNTAYWGSGPHFDNLTFQVIPDESDRFSAVQNDTAQVAVGLPEDYAVNTAADSNLRALWRPAFNFGYLGLNRAHPPLDNDLVRMAIAHAINKQNILTTIYGPGDEIAHQFLPSFLWGYNPQLADYTYDPALAQTLLGQAGYQSGFTTTLSYRTLPRPYMPLPANVAAAVHADLLVVGIDATVTVYDSSTFLDKMWNGELDLFLVGWVGDYPHPDDFLYPILCGTYLAYGSRDDTLCNSLLAAQTETDFMSQLSMYQSASERVRDTLPVLPLANVRNLLVARKTVAGLTPSMVGIEAYKDVFIASAWVHLPLVRQ
jgi:peptide/nickel transport system substrate-binding protein